MKGWGGGSIEGRKRLRGEVWKGEFVLSEKGVRGSESTQTYMYRVYYFCKLGSVCSIIDKIKKTKVIRVF